MIKSCLAIAVLLAVATSYIFFSSNGEKTIDEHSSNPISTNSTTTALDNSKFQPKSENTHPEKSPQKNASPSLPPSATQVAVTALSPSPDSLAVKIVKETAQRGNVDIAKPEEISKTKNQRQKKVHMPDRISPVEAPRKIVPFQNNNNTATVEKNTPTPPSRISGQRPAKSRDKNEENISERTRVIHRLRREWKEKFDNEFLGKSFSTKEYQHYWRVHRRFVNKVIRVTREHHKKIIKAYDQERRTKGGRAKYPNFRSWKKGQRYLVLYNQAGKEIRDFKRECRKELLEVLTDENHGAYLELHMEFLKETKEERHEWRIEPVIFF